MTERLNHKLDTSKIKTLEDVKNIFECMNLYAFASEDAKDYELIKEYFTIPNPSQELKFELPRKSLEEIKQELDEKFEKLIVRTKRNFYASKLTTERNFENKFQKIFDGFECIKCGERRIKKYNGDT
jgi:DNA polymerase III sliding clamp (beta) subunit (PCNA family)